MLATPAMSFDVIAQVPGGLAVPPSPYPPPATPAPWAEPIGTAVLDPGRAARQSAHEPNRPAGGTQSLRSAVDAATLASLSSEHGQLTRHLPRLIGRIELCSLEAPDRDHLAILRLLSDAYAVASWTLNKADNPAIAWLAAERAIRAAERVDDKFRVAAATRCLAEVYMRARRYDDASRTAFLASAYLDTAEPSRTPTALCLRGAALLSATAAAARRGDRREAYAALNAAASHGGGLRQNRVDLGTMFGATNVAIHRVAVAVELSDPREAVAHIPSVDLSSMPAYLTERRARFLIDVARAHAMLDDRSAAIGPIDAERTAPAETRSHRLTHELLHNLMRRERRSSKLRELAVRCGLER